MTHTDDLLTAEDVVKLTNVSLSTIRRHTAAGRLPLAPESTPSVYKFRRSDVDAWNETRKWKRVITTTRCA